MNSLDCLMNLIPLPVRVRVHMNPFVNANFSVGC